MARPPVAWHVIRRALVRSRIKLRVLFALLDHEALFVADLARAARASEQWVWGAIRGDGVAFRVETSLGRLRLVSVRSTPLGALVRITPLGRVVARAWRQDAVRALVGAERSVHA